MELMISVDGGGERDDAAMAVSLAAGSDSDRPDGSALETVLAW